MKFFIDPDNSSRIYLIGEDNREVFEIQIVNGHSIRISSERSTIKDKEKLYDASLSIVPKTCDSVVITRNEYE